MRRAVLLSLFLPAAACGPALRAGPTGDGIAVAVRARDKAAARREAIESVLPLFMTDSARRERSAALEKAVFGGGMKPFIGSLKAAKNGKGLAEVRVDALSSVLQRAGLVRPEGYAAGPQAVLIALGDRTAGPTSTERYAADALETALFGRGIQAQDADDQLVKLAKPITAKTEAETVSQAAAAGWGWLATGGAVEVARRDETSKSWRARARYSLSLYGIRASTQPTRFEAEAQALDVSSAAAAAQAVEAAAQEAAARVDAAMTRRAAGRATIGVFVSGWKDPVFLRRLVEELRAADGVAGAALVSWRSLDDMALFHVYAGALTADALAAKLINRDAELRVTAVETADQRLMIAGPQIPESEDQGQE